ncbi:unnamed protein product [Parnassius apollo]|uniref:(apollo) hypothetical protein n=1 Tax=Parnassius apollo TaxID=110799 RepID=A0A8S3WKG7_PARAO|nr:unnamed protein product [Parnassius apollo]
MPPFFIFPRVKYRPDFVNGGPEGSDGDSYITGWMTAKSFLKFMEHFKKHSHASKDNPVLLILDNHESHVSIEVISYAKSNGITLLILPPHCSNKLQPLDIAIYSSFKSRYNTALSNWMLSNPGRTVTIYQIHGFIKTIMSQAFSQANILSGFKKSGIHPYNDNLFSDEDFMCSAVTDRDISNENYELPSSSSQKCSSKKLSLSFQALSKIHQIFRRASTTLIRKFRQHLNRSLMMKFRTPI